MRLWPALLGSPLLALCSISLGYALVPAACSLDAAWLLHVVIIALLALSMAATLFAVGGLRRAREPFLGLVATGMGAFFSLVIAAQWAVQLFLPPCLH